MIRKDLEYRDPPVSSLCSYSARPSDHSWILSLFVSRFQSLLNNTIAGITDMIRVGKTGVLEAAIEHKMHLACSAVGLLKLGADLQHAFD